jgi:hypothetical protein
MPQEHIAQLLKAHFVEFVRHSDDKFTREMIDIMHTLPGRYKEAVERGVIKKDNAIALANFCYSSVSFEANPGIVKSLKQLIYSRESRLTAADMNDLMALLEDQLKCLKETNDNGFQMLKFPDENLLVMKQALKMVFTQKMQIRAFQLTELYVVCDVKMEDLASHESHDDEWYDTSESADKKKRLKMVNEFMFG